MYTLHLHEIEVQKEAIAFASLKRNIRADKSMTWHNVNCSMLATGLNEKKWHVTLWARK